jgi:2-methylisocitrate lyase-like PEP mutase family enzyme
MKGIVMDARRMGDKLRAILAEPGLAPNASVFNPMGARLVARSTWFAFAILSGFEVAAMEYGLPDTGYLNSSDLAEVMSRISRAEPLLPVIVDGETGYGSPAHVRHTVLKHAMAGAAGVMIEDQTWPRQCPFITGEVTVVSRPEARARMSAALDAGRDAGVMILARTDAKASLGLEEALDRCRMFADLGAEMLIVEGVSSEAEIERVCSATDLPMVINQHPGTSAPTLSASRLLELGVKSPAYHPLFETALAAMRASVESLETTGGYRADLDRVPFREAAALAGFDAYERVERTYLV